MLRRTEVPASGAARECYTQTWTLRKETPMQDRTDIRLNAPTADDDPEDSGSGEDLADLSYTPRQDEDDALA